ncbi:unnamed protein product [Chrysoparadoxa australica]
MACITTALFGGLVAFFMVLWMILIIMMTMLRKRILWVTCDPDNIIFTNLRLRDWCGLQLSSRVPEMRLPRRDDGRAVSLETGKLSSTKTSKRRQSARKRSETPSGVKLNDGDEHPRWEIQYDEIAVHEKIGEGSYAEVYRGVWCETPAAIKVPGKGKAQIERLRMEVNIMSKFHHPNVVMLLGACVVEPDICLVMEYLPRGTLFDFIHRVPTKFEALEGDGDGKESRQYSKALAHKFATDIARGMRYLHGRAGIIQRDLKSPNLLLDVDFNVKICDFGLSQEYDMEQNDCLNTEHGTPAWVAPEIIRKEKYNQKADVYSYGIVLWELQTGEIPYQGMTPYKVAHAVAREGLRPNIPPDALDGYVQLLNSCWQDEPRERYVDHRYLSPRLANIPFAVLASRVA